MTQEIWKPVKEYEGLYEVSNMGRIKGLTRNQIKKQGISNWGYSTVTLSRNSAARKKLVHRLVAEAFIPNPDELPEVNHIDGDKQNNSVGNLEWCTASENLKHAWNLGLTKGKTGQHMSQFSRTKMSNSLKGKFDGEKNPMYGKTRPDVAKRNRETGKSVMCVETGKVFDTLVVAGCSVGLTPYAIGNVCRGLNKTAGGFHWKYVEVEGVVNG